jgi:hypothetical protein
MELEPPIRASVVEQINQLAQKAHEIPFGNSSSRSARFFQHGQGDHVEPADKEHAQYALTKLLGKAAVHFLDDMLAQNH